MRVNATGQAVFKLKFPVHVVTMFAWGRVFWCRILQSNVIGIIHYSIDKPGGLAQSASGGWAR
jgi:hypothetical protein